MSRSRLDDYAPEMQDPGDGDMFGAIADAAAAATRAAAITRYMVALKTVPSYSAGTPVVLRLPTPTTARWRCECGDLNGEHEAFCYRCGAGGPS